MNVDTHVLAGAYVCHALDPSESFAFETHLDLCETCTEEVAELRATLAALAVTAIEAPPFGLHDRVMGQIELLGQAAAPAARTAPALESVRRVRARGRGRRRSHDRDWTHPPKDRPSSHLDDPAGGEAEHHHGRIPGWAPTAALVAGLLALGSVAGYQHHQIDDLSGRTPAGGQILDAADAQVATGEMRSGGTATVISSRADGEMYFTAADLPALPPGKAYQLWLVDAGGTVPGPVLDPVDGSVADVVAARLAGVESVAMTVEPAVGSTRPTSPQVLILSLQ